MTRGRDARRRAARVARGLAAAVLALSCVGRAPDARAAPDDPGAGALARAAAWLWSRQRADGGWGSETYRLLEPGDALTGVILCALQDVPAGVAPPPPGGVERALAFLRARVAEDGTLGRRRLLEYPTYATAFGLRALARAGVDADRPLARRMAAALVARQYREDVGFGTGTVAHGGWGFDLPGPGPGDPGHMDLSHTWVALEALREADALDPAVAARAARYLALLQRDPAATARQPLVPGDEPAAVPLPPARDGGFYFSPVVVVANKARHRPATAVSAATFESYATATSDGLLALLALGATPDDPRVRAARDWLAARPDLARVGGLPDDPREADWSAGLRHYHLAVRALAYRRAGGPPGWQAEVARLLAASQRADGSFASASGLMKEDDPLVATPLAVLALAAATAR